MSEFETAIRIMKHLFGRDYQFTLSTAKDNIPSSRMVDTFFDGESFYVVTHRQSRKVTEIENNPNVSLCGRKMHAFSGQAYNIGHPLKPENAAVRSLLIEAFEPWYFKHNDESDENMCFLRISPTAGFFHADGTGYRINFTKRNVNAFPFSFDTVLTED